MKWALGIVLSLCSCLSAADDATVSVPLSVPAGAPLRLFLTKRVSKKKGAPVEAKVMEPVFAFDREVIPAGTLATGEVARTRSLGKWERCRAIVGGDFTPLHRAQVEFHELLLPDGRKLEIHTDANQGLNTIYVEPKRKKAKTSQKTSQPGTGVLGTAKSAARDRINAEINNRSRGIADLVRGPNKKERMYDFLLAKLPYHPQYLRRGTRFDSVLEADLPMGTAAIARKDLTEIGTQPPPDSAVRARLLTPLDSVSAKMGQPVEAVVAAPLFSSDHKLLIPEGTRITGAVVVAQKARMFHRGGKLRFNFQKVDFQKLDMPRTETLQTQAILAGAEPSGQAAIKVDAEGGVKATESKTRLLAPLLALVVANKAADADAGRHAAGGSAEGNVSGRTLGGGLGFGMLGSAISQSSKYVGMGFGYYGLAWSVYSNVVARGGEVQFDRNAMVDIKFGARPQPPAASKLVSTTH
jgi:hypothetical protein